MYDMCDKAINYRREQALICTILFRITSTSILPKIPLSDTSVPRCNITNYIYTT